MGRASVSRPTERMPLGIDTGSCRRENAPRPCVGRPLERDISMHRLALSLAVLGFFINPGLACSPSDSGYQFGEAEMRAAVEGTWQLSFVADGGAISSLTVQIRESSEKLDSGTALRSDRRRTAGFIRAAAACGSRTFLRSAGACADMSEMPLDVSYVAGDVTYQGVPMGGIFRTSGTTFGGGGLEFGCTNGFTVNASILPDGTVFSTDSSVVALARLAP